LAYIPDWEPLADALKRVMATGASEEEAKTDLCRAVADGKIRVRVRIATSHYKRGSVFSGGNVVVPAHLAPRDFDWARSRPIAQWRIGPRIGEHYFWNSENLPLDFIELWTADVAQVLCNRDGDELVQQPTKFELVLNLRTAKSLGIEFSAKLLALADEVIE
jgi:hypothetical protein